MSGGKLWSFFKIFNTVNTRKLKITMINHDQHAFLNLIINYFINYLTLIKL